MLAVPVAFNVDGAVDDSVGDGAVEGVVEVAGFDGVEIRLRALIYTIPGRRPRNDASTIRTIIELGAMELYSASYHDCSRKP